MTNTLLNATIPDYVAGSFDLVRSRKFVFTVVTIQGSQRNSVRLGGAAPALCALRERFSRQRLFLASSPVFTMLFVVPRQPFRSKAVASSWEGLNRTALKSRLHTSL